MQDCGDDCDEFVCFFVPVSPACNGTGGSATLIGAGGQLPFTYLWDDGQTTETAINLPAGPIGTTITDANGCESIAIITIEEDPNCAPASISITKLTNGVDINNAPQPIIVVTPNAAPPVEWTYIVTNTGTTTLTNVQIQDDLEGFICSMPTLAPGQSQTCTQIGVTQLGFYENIGTVTADGPGGSVTAQDTSAYIGAFINVEKTASASCVCPGEEVDFTLTIRLLGGAPGINIRDISVTDTHVPGILDVNSPQFVTASDVGGDGRINFIDANGDGISDEEFLFRYTLQIDSTITNTAMDMGMLFFEDTSVGMVNNQSSVTITASDACCAMPGTCDTEFKPTAVTDASCGASDGAIDISVINGVAPLSFAWSNGQTTEDIAGVPAGSYTVTITDADGCSISDSFLVVSAGCGQVGNLVWEDLDSDGVQDAGEPGIANAQVQLVDSATGTVVSNVFTNTNGEYCFEAVAQGSYFVQIVSLPTAFASHIPTFSDRSADGVDSDITSTNAVLSSDTFTLTDGEINKTIDAGFYEGNIIGNQVWLESSTSGLINGFDTGDTPIENLEVNLLDAATTLVLATEFTDPFGRYLFQDVPAGDYIVQFIAPADMTFITPNDLNNAGVVNDEEDSDAIVDIFNPRVGLSQIITVESGTVNLTIDAGLRMESTILAISLLDIAVSHDEDDNMNVLDWTTEREVNSDFFAIERSIGDVDDFVEIGQESASGKTVSATDYFFNDRDISKSGTYYYRLRSVDTDESYTYSKIVSVEVDSERAENQKVVLDVYPNPVLNEINIDLVTEYDSKIDGGIYDAIGQQIEKIDRDSVSAGKTSMKLQISHLPAGTYLLRMQVGKQVIFEKITKAE